MKSGFIQDQTKKLAYLELGLPGGIPVLFFHGFPGCANQALLFQKHLESHGLHILSPDRPGYGDSSPESIYDFDAFLANCRRLVDQHGWTRFHVVGVSGGAPYARMMSLLYPEQAISCVSICGLGLLDKINIAHMKPYEQWGLRLVRRMPPAWTLRLLQGFLKRIQPDLAYRKMLAEASAADLPVLQEPQIKKIMDESFLIATRQGALGIHFDLLVYARRLERSLGAFACPVVLFHGDDDPIVPIQMSEDLARRIPQAELIPLPNEGHFSLPIRHSRLMADKILALHQALSK